MDDIERHAIPGIIKLWFGYRELKIPGSGNYRQQYLRQTIRALLERTDGVYW